MLTSNITTLKIQQDRQRTYNVIFRHVRAAIVEVEKQ